MSESVSVRVATAADHGALYAIGLTAPELQVSESDPFMSEEEFLGALQNPAGIFLVAEVVGIPVGFIYATTQDIERQMLQRWACMVYIVVAAEFRGLGVAGALYDECLRMLRERGITHFYAWAHAQDSAPQADTGIAIFLKRRGFSPGHLYRWFDRTI